MMMKLAAVIATLGLGVSADLKLAWYADNKCKTQTQVSKALEPGFKIVFDAQMGMIYGAGNFAGTVKGTYKGQTCAVTGSTHQVANTTQKSVNHKCVQDATTKKHTAQFAFFSSADCKGTESAASATVTIPKLPLNECVSGDKINSSIPASAYVLATMKGCGKAPGASGATRIAAVASVAVLTGLAAAFFA